MRTSRAGAKMTSIRPFQPTDLFHFNSVNFDKFTETVRSGAYVNRPLDTSPKLSLGLIAVRGAILPGLPGKVARILPYLHRARWRCDRLHTGQGGGPGAQLAWPRHCGHCGAREPVRH